MAQMLRPKCDPRIGQCAAIWLLTASYRAGTFGAHSEHPDRSPLPQPPVFTEAHQSTFRVWQRLCAPFPASSGAPSPHCPPPEFPPAHLLLRQPLHGACLKCGPFLETVPCHYLSPSKFQFVVLIPSNCIQSKRVSGVSALSSPCTRHNLPTTVLEANYSQTHPSPPGRQPSGDTQGPPLQVFAKSVQGPSGGTTGQGVPFHRECSGSPSLGFVGRGEHPEGRWGVRL